MMELKLTLPCFLMFFLFKDYNCVQPPAYISAWTTMDTTTTTELEFNHGLGQVPYMHEVQIRSSSGFVYPGVKTAFSDNDNSTPRGGVVCLYNSTAVKLYAASGLGAYLIFTGQTGYTPENQEVTSSADVRVRLWIASNLPVPDVVLTSTLQAGNDAENSRILVHNLGSIPELNVVQLEVVINSQVWYGEGVGTSQHLDGNTNLNWGGVVFGVGTNQVKLWAPSDRYDNEGCLNFCDGWGPLIYSHCNAAGAKVTVRMWVSLGSNKLVDHPEQHFIGDDDNKHEYTMSKTYDEDNDFITVRSRTIDGSFPSLYFDGTGAAMFDNQPGLGGLIYAYKASTGQLRIWHPNNAGSYIIKVGPYMGSQTPAYAHASTSVMVVTRVWQGSYCPSAPTVNFATVVETLTTATYTCASSYDHTSGDLQLTCDPSYTWSGTLPVCSPDCGNAPTVADATSSETSSTVTYTCVSPYVLTSGSRVRTCQTDGTWSGTSPVCTQCYEAGNIDGYVGTQDVAENGVSCVYWDMYTYTDADDFPDDTLNDAENYCRNPTGWNSLWCLTDLNGDWEKCDVPVCGMLSTAPPTTTPLVTTTPPATTTTSAPATSTTLLSTPAPTPASTPATTSAPTPSPTSAAPAECTNCVCYNNVSSSSEAIAEAIVIAEQIVANLTIESKTTSKYARSLSSAVDERQSSFYVGMFGAGLCGALVLLIVIPDIIKLVSYILCRHKPHTRLTEDTDEFY